MYEPQSPCTGVCRIDAATGWCSGCRRTRAEIAAWRDLDTEAKRAVLAKVRQRSFWRRLLRKMR
ncbi:DUF1289 domain-containing protein [Novosphingobium marinum]|uniref:DUF1289 domain-containing protein n=1 Tax=Novosphingobium marinum TaxID=1514948 RepID=UPI0015C6A292|nr:DUF1289 domain-containing protein [Novosphingobium marinum]